MSLSPAGRDGAEEAVVSASAGSRSWHADGLDVEVGGRAQPAANRRSSSAQSARRPVASPPRGRPGRPSSFQAKRSRCAQLVVSRTNSLRKKAAVIEPASGLLPALLMSAMVPLDVAAIARMQRQPPERVVGCGTCSREIAGQGLVGREQGRQLRAQGDARGAGEGRGVEQEGRALAVASASASARIRRPSASVLPISTVIPLRMRITSPGRKASPAMLFSTVGTRRRRRTGRRAP